MDEGPIRLLVVDDDEADVRLVKCALGRAQHREGFVFETAKTLSECLQALKNRDLNLVLLDLGLPDCNGVETVRRVSRAVPEIPIVVLTGLADEEMGLAAIREGAEDYLVKGSPLEHTLIRTIRYALERKRTQQALARQAEALSQSNAELERANVELKELDRMKSDFLSSVSHELRTPLTAIRAYSETLLNCRDVSEEKRQSFTRIVLEQTERLTLIIEDLLDLSRAEAGKLRLDLQPVDVQEAIEASLDTVLPIAERKGVDIQLEPLREERCVLADKERLVQILVNLLNNAVKFTNSAGVIRLRAVPVSSGMCHEAPPGAEHAFLCVTVSDSGIGIPEKELGHVFDKFRQVANGAGGKPCGTGLGLTICKELVEKMAGHIWVESTVGEGSEFHFTLPLVGVTSKINRSLETRELSETRTS
ncbi:MAG: ATP-binding protein [Candidatus Eisenbacteria bacterium]